jgi:hypothetical protein
MLVRTLRRRLLRRHSWTRPSSQRRVPPKNASETRDPEMKQARKRRELVLHYDWLHS